MSRKRRKKERAARGPHKNKYGRFSKAEQVAAELYKRLEIARKRAEREAAKRREEERRVRVFGFSSYGSRYLISTEGSNYLPREYTTAEPDWMNRGLFSGEYDF